MLDVYFLSGEHFFISKGNEPLRELIVNREFFEYGGKKHKRKSKDYIGILKATLNDSPNTQKKVEQLANLNAKSLVKIAHEYHNEVCNEECIIYQKEGKDPVFTIGVFGKYEIIRVSDFSFSRLENLNSYLFYYLDFGEENHIINVNQPGIGVFLKRNLPFIDERLFLSLEGSVSKWDIHEEREYTKADHQNYHGRLIYDFSKNIISSAIMFQYEVRSEKMLKPFLQFGYFHEFYSNQKFNGIIELNTDLTSPTNITIKENLKNNNGLLGGIGLISNRSKYNFWRLYISLH